MTKNSNKMISAALVLTMLCTTLTGCAANVEGKTVQAKSIAGIETLNDINGKRIGCVSGTTGYSLASQTDGAQVESFGTSKEAIISLVNGAVDAVIIDKDIAEKLVNDYKNTKILSEPFAEEEYAICYSKENTELGAKIDKVLTEIKEDGTLDEIKSHWIGDDADKQSYVPLEGLDYAGGTLKMGTNACFAPYESFADGASNTEIVGIDVDMMHAISDRLNMKFEVANMEFDAVIPAVEKGSVDVGVAAITITDERKEVVNFTQEYTKTNQVVIVKTE